MKRTILLWAFVALLCAGAARAGENGGPGATHGGETGNGRIAAVMHGGETGNGRIAAVAHGGETGNGRFAGVRA